MTAAQRMSNLTKWKFLPEGQSLYFNNDKQRVVIVDVNVPGEACFYVKVDREFLDRDPERVLDREADRIPGPGDDPQELQFVGLVRGRDRLEFNVEGPFNFVAEGCGVYFYTADSIDIAFRPIAPVVFTQIIQRRERNPQLEWIMWKQQENQRRLLEGLRAETAAAIAQVKEGTRVSQKYIRTGAGGTPERVGPEQDGKGLRSGGAPSEDARKVEEPAAERRGASKKKKAETTDDV